ncbi:MAG: hypothetical protein ACFBWO_01325 [Paracoccaceae bacterium]
MLRPLLVVALLVVALAGAAVAQIPSSVRTEQATLVAETVASDLDRP